jgi:HlyD family secretion protein
MNATTVQNVVTYNTIIDFDNPELKLFPGMTAYISIPVANAQSVLRVANGAIRYKPDMTADEIRALYKQYGLVGSDQGQTAQAATDSDGQPKRGGQGAQAAGANGAASAQRTQRIDVAVVWKLNPDKSLEPVRIRTGITDHTTTAVAQLLKGDLKEGDQLVTGGMATASAARPPSMGGTPGRR